MSLAELSPICSGEIERVIYGGKIGRGSFELEIFQDTKLPRQGGIMVLQAPGYTDEDAYSRIPLAETLAGMSEDLPIRSGLIKHMRGSITRPRQQRSMNVHGATKLAEEVVNPDLIILLGHSFGGDNVNDSAVNNLSMNRKERSSASTVVIHEATPGTEEPFHFSSSIRRDLFSLKTGSEASNHPAKTLALSAHEAPRLLGVGPHQSAVRLAELAALNGICIANGTKRLEAAGVPVINVDYDDDRVIYKRAGHVIMRGSHLHSYYEPEEMASFIRDKVIPMTTSGH